MEDHVITFFEYNGIKIQEPFTVLTDLIIAAVCFYAFAKIRKEKPRDYLYFFLKYFFLFMGFATVTGGVLGHGFMYYFGPVAKIPGWYISMISIACIERAAIIHSRPLMKASAGNFFSVLNILELITFMSLAAYYVKFIFVEIHAIYGLQIVVFSFELYVLIKTKDKGSKYFMGALVLAGIAAAFHGLRISINVWFNHNDVSHLWMALSMWFFYKGAMSLHIYEPASELPKTSVV